MKCPICAEAELVHDTRDIPYIYKGESTTIRSFLDQIEAPIGVQQELMRHAQVATTMNVYGNAQMQSKRKANTQVVKMVLPFKEDVQIAS